MALRLMVEGRVVQVRQAEPYFTSDTLAEMWGREGAEARERLNIGGTGVRRPLRIPRLRALEQMAEDGRIRKIQLQAGLEVRAYWHVWCTAHLPRVANIDGVVVSGGRMPDSPSALALSRRRQAWSARAMVQRVKGDLSVLQLVEDLCVRDWTPTEMRREYRISNARALRVIQVSLLEYGHLAGWKEIEREAA